MVEWQIGERSRAEIAIFGFGFFCFDSEIVILRVWGLGRRVERTAVEQRKKENEAGTNGSGEVQKPNKEGKKKKSKLVYIKNLKLKIKKKRESKTHLLLEKCITLKSDII